MKYKLDKGVGKSGIEEKYSLLLCICLFLPFSEQTVFAYSGPTISEVTAIPRPDGSGIVDISYTLSSPEDGSWWVTIEVSVDDGKTWSIIPSPAVLSGDLGPIGPGIWHISWDSKIDLPWAFGNNYRVKIMADSYMVVIPAGTFQMGNSKNASEGWSNELPVHTVTVDSFAIGKYEITNGQYRDFLNSARTQGLITVNTNGIVYKADSGTSYPYCDTSASSSWSQIVYSNNTFSVRTKNERDMTNDPMVMVSWYGAVAYCNWRSQQEGKQTCYNDFVNWTCDFSKKGYRLPTEAEWEYAARGGRTGNRFPWGDTITQGQANYNSSIENAYYDISPTHNYHPIWYDGVMPYTSPVGSFPANGYGLYDMAGNVYEWCQDWYDENYYASSPTNDPQGPSSGYNRVLRGGGYLTFPANNCRVSNREYSTPTRPIRSCEDGFRPVLDF